MSSWTLAGEEREEKIGDGKGLTTIFADAHHDGAIEKRALKASKQPHVVRLLSLALSRSLALALSLSLSLAVSFPMATRACQKQHGLPS